MTPILHQGTNYYPVPALDLLKCGQKIHCFVRLQNQDLIKSSSLKDLILQQKVDTVYLHPDDLQTFTRLVIKGPDQVKPSLKNLAHQTNLALWCLKHHGLTEQNLPLIESIAQNLVALEEDLSLGEIFKQIPPGESQRYIMRTLLSKLLCLKLQYYSPATLYKVMLASLLCDLGEHFNPQNVHPLKASVSAVENLRVNNDIQTIILHHHEVNDASGPMGVSKYKIHPLAKVIRLSDEFVIRLMSLKETRKEIIQDLVSQCPKKYDKNLVTALNNCFSKE